MIYITAGIMVTLILAIIGLAKLPFKKFKEQHPKWYKATFTIASIVLTIGLCIIDQLFILNKGLWTWDFVILLTTTFTGVLGSYNAVWEGLGVKELWGKIVGAIKKLYEVAPESKLIKQLNKVDIDKAIQLLIEAKNNKQ